MRIGLHHHREQALIDPAAPLHNDGKNEPLPSLGMRTSKFPAAVLMIRDRDPLPWFVLVSVRSCGPGRVATTALPPLRPSGVLTGAQPN